MHPLVPGTFEVQEGHDMAMETHSDGVWIEKKPLGAPELGPGEVEFVRPVLNAADAGAFNEGGRADTNGISLLRKSRKR